MPRGAVIAALLALGCGLSAGCAGSGAVVADGVPCSVWLDGNGRDAYLQAHGLPTYDAGSRAETAAIGRVMTETCSDAPELVVDEALRRAAQTVRRHASPAG